MPKVEINFEEVLLSLAEWCESNCVLKQKRKTFFHNGILRYEDNWMPAVHTENSRPISTNSINSLTNGCVELHVTKQSPLRKKTEIEIMDNPAANLDHMENGENNSDTDQAIVSSVLHKSRESLTTNSNSKHLASNINLSVQIRTSMSVAEDNDDDNKRFSNLKNRETSSEELRSVDLKFLTNWKSLWDEYLLESVEQDEVARCAPLLRKQIDFFFHPWTRRIMVNLSIYNLIIAIVSYQLYPTNKSLLYNAVTYPVVGLLVYMSAHVLLTGSTWSRKSISYSNKKNQSRKSLAAKGNFGLVDNQPKSSWFFSLSQMYTHSYRDFKEVFCSFTRRKFVRVTPIVSFYDIMNISLKFLTKHNGIRIETVNFNRSQYSTALQIISLFIPFYIVFARTGFLNLYLYFIYCNNGEGGYLTLMITAYLFIGSTILSLVALAYAAEIAYQMTNSWVKRFTTLRKVPVSDDMMHGQGFEHLPSEDVELLSIIPRIKRDSYEHYLFIQNYMNQCGQFWSARLVCLLLLVCYLFSLGVLSFYHAAKIDNFELAIATSIFIFVRLMVLVAYPFLSIAHANKYINPLVNSFIISSPEDFSILGGRDAWIAFLTTAPAIWDFYSVWITYDKLIGLSATIALTGLSYVLADISSAFA
eukprot:gene14992-20167_t